MYLVLMRHGIATPTAAGGIDAERTLTEEGRRRVEAAARLLNESPWKVARIICSPLRRARQTAEIIASILPGEIEEEPGVSPGMDPGFAADLAARHPGPGALMIVGHQPDLSMAARALSGTALDFDEGAVAVIRVSGSAHRRGRLDGFVRGDAVPTMRFPAGR